MGALAPAAFVTSHTDIAKGLSVPAAAIPTPVHCPMLTFEASSLWFTLGNSDKCVATGAWNDLRHHLWVRPHAQWQEQLAQQRGWIAQCPSCSALHSVVRA